MAHSRSFTGRSGPQCILVIDDDNAVRTSIKLFLEDFNYLVLEADNGHSGLEIFKRHHPDLILLDLRMPEMSGLDFLQQVRQAASEVPVIVISGTGRIDDVIEALRYGAADFLLKPINDLLVLQHSVENVFEKTQLKQENRDYREHLEEIISQRTATLERTYQQLTASEEKYRSIFDNLQDIYFETTLDGVLKEISPSLEKITQYKRTELLGSNIMGLYAKPEQREQMLQLLQLNGKVADYEILLIDSDGSLLYFSINAMLYFNSAGVPTHITGNMRNINERKNTEEKLRATNQTLEALFNAAPQAIMAIDSEEQITLWNHAAEQTFGWTAQEIIGKPYPLVPPGREAEAEQLSLIALQGRNEKSIELTRMHKDGHLVDISLSTAPLRDKDQNSCGLIIMMEDISEKKRLQNETERSNRLASLGELAAGVAHEINNPNGLILLNLPTIRDFVLDGIEQLQCQNKGQKLGGLSLERASQSFPQLLDEIEDGARRIKQIVDDLKAFSAQDILEQDKHVDLNVAAETAVRLTSNHLKKATATFEIQPTLGLPPIKGSTQRIEQVIVNLLVNACEALTDREQKILIRSGVDSTTGAVYLSVTDEGRGIEPKQLPHITDPFFTTRREEGGTGLGLSVSARIVKEHQGRLDFTSTLGKGTTACLTFPPLQ